MPGIGRAIARAKERLEPQTANASPLHRAGCVPAAGFTCGARPPLAANSRKPYPMAMS